MIPRTLNSIQQNGRFGTGGGRRFQLAGTFGNQPSDRTLAPAGNLATATSSVDVHDTVTLTGVTVAQLQSHLRDFTFFSERIRNVESITTSPAVARAPQAATRPPRRAA
jgi:hypothetical protein